MSIIDHSPKKSDPGMSKARCLLARDLWRSDGDPLVLTCNHQQVFFTKSMPSTRHQVGVVSFLSTRAWRGDTTQTSRSVTSWQAVGYAAAASHIEYAAVHGYVYLSAGNCTHRDVELALRAVSPPQWVKIFLLLRCFRNWPQLEYLMWVDADVVITRLDVSLPMLVWHAHSNQTRGCTVTAAADSCPRGCRLNTGVMLLKRTRPTTRLLQAVTERSLWPGALDAPLHEQRAMVRLWEEEAWARSVICIAPRRTLQSFLKLGEYSIGDFSAHLTATSDAAVRPFLPSAWASCSGEGLLRLSLSGDTRQPARVQTARFTGSAFSRWEWLLASAMPHAYSRNQCARTSLP